jgi:hypothetical protein
MSPGHPLTQLPVGHPERLLHLAPQELADSELLTAYHRKLIDKRVFDFECVRRFKERVGGEAA